MVHFRFNQRRVLTVRYLGELYNYRCVSSSIIFDTLYSFISFGHPNGKPDRKATIVSKVDPPTEFFRIKLITELLDTCGHYFNKGGSRKRLDNFLVYFNYYILTKNADAFPLEIEFSVEDTLQRLRPGFKRSKTFEEAEERLNELEKELMTPEMIKMLQEAEREEEVEPEARRSLEEQKEEALEIEEASSVEKVQTAQQQEVSFQEISEFNKDLQEMLSESLASRRNEKKSVLDVAIPMSFKEKKQQGSNGNRGQVKFKVMTRGASSEKSLIVPSDSNLALSTAAKRQEKQKEQDELKKITLKMAQNQA
jgi:regulator of nonsense transcripts 2